jgi:osmotically-inducible protein OsmY
MTDFDIRHAVLAAIEAAPDIVCTAIGVAVHGGVVTLTGRVASFAEKDAAGRVALRAEGVRGVANELDVCDAEESYLVDEVIAAQIAEHLRTIRGRMNVKVTVTRGSVTLSGAVDHEDQRRALRIFAQGLEGVEGVYDHMTAREQGAA